MQKEFLAPRQAICMILLFIFGSTMIMGGNADAKQDSWLSLLLAVAISVPILLIYSRIISLYPEQGLFDILQKVFGKVIGKVLTLFMTWYAVHLGALVIHNFSEFIKIINMPETPEFPLMLIMLLVVVYMAKSGVKTLGKWAVFALPVLIAMVLFTVILSFKDMKIEYLMPVAAHDFGTIAGGAYKLFTFPFIETVLFLTLAGSIKKQDSPYKIYFIALAISCFVLLLVILRNITVIGSAMVGSEYFPSYISARILSVGEFLTRIEGSISMNFMLGGIPKISVCLLAAVKGFSALFNVKDEKQIVFPVGLVMLALCAVVYSSIMEMFSFLGVYQFYAIPFQIIIPVAVWIGAEIKTRKGKKKQKSTPSAPPPTEFITPKGVYEGE